MPSGMTIAVKVTKNEFARITGELKQESAAIVGATVFNIEAGAKMRTVRIRTGAMRNGWQGQHAAGALTGMVTTNIYYAIFHEHGTVHISPSPMLYPAAEAERGPFRAAFESLIRGLA